MAEAHNANMLPLNEPFSSLPNARLNKFFLSPVGEYMFAASLMLMSPSANLNVFGEKLSLVRSSITLNVVLPPVMLYYIPITYLESFQCELPSVLYLHLEESMRFRAQSCPY